MAQRHPALIPLASDHYNGLALALRLQQGTQAPASMWSNDSKFQAGYVVSFFEKELRHHFEVEEKALFPLVIQHIVDARALVDELIADHRTMEQSARKLCETNSPTLARELNEFGKLLEQHIRKEDRQLFPLFESRAPADVLEKAVKEVGEYYPAHSGRP